MNKPLPSKPESAFSASADEALPDTNKTKAAPRRPTADDHPDVQAIDAEIQKNTAAADAINEEGRALRKKRDAVAARVNARSRMAEMPPAEREALLEEARKSPPQGVTGAGAVETEEKHGALGGS